ncbi:MAG TPA: hypothetical protein VMK12_15135 [Anaeromyxobacteraceae bacterium]|nr:hypothetical protein [Anaeromyxobacteraceae bacterium]
MTRPLILALVAAVVFMGAASLAGSARFPALVGAGGATGSAVVSLAAFALTSRSARPIQTGLLIFGVMFVLRILLVAVGTLAVSRTGGSVIAFVIAFFVPYFVFAAIEASYLHVLGRRLGKPA